MVFATDDAVDIAAGDPPIFPRRLKPTTNGRGPLRTTADIAADMVVDMAANIAVHCRGYYHG